MQAVQGRGDRFSVHEPKIPSWRLFFGETQPPQRVFSEGTTSATASCVGTFGQALAVLWASFSSKDRNLV